MFIRRQFRVTGTPGAGPRCWSSAGRARSLPSARWSSPPASGSPCPASATPGPSTPAQRSDLSIYIFRFWAKFTHVKLRYSFHMKTLLKCLAGNLGRLLWPTISRLDCNLTGEHERATWRGGVRGFRPLCPQHDGRRVLWPQLRHLGQPTQPGQGQVSLDVNSITVRGGG